MRIGGFAFSRRAAVLAAGLAVVGLTASAAYDVKPSAIRPRWQGAEAGEWTMDYTNALARAKGEGKHTLMLVSGMWWCPHCQALESGVLTTPEWEEYVSAGGFYLTVLDFPYRDGVSNFCWLWDEGYLRDAGLTAAEGQRIIEERYLVQDAYSVPGATLNKRTFAADGSGPIEYHQIGYPTLIVLRPDGRTAGRFSVSKAYATLAYVTNRIEQIRRADEWDERDDYWQNATELPVQECEGEPVLQGEHTLGLADSADWFRLPVRYAGCLWTFRFGASDSFPAEKLRVEVYDSPSSTPLQSVTVDPQLGEEVRVILPKVADYHLKVTYAATPKSLIGYALSYGYEMAPATVSFSSSTSTVYDHAGEVSLPVKISGADPSAEVSVDWSVEDVAGSAIEDLGLTAGTLTWAAGEKKVRKSISVPLRKPSAWKGDRSFRMTLRSHRHCSIPEKLSECVVTIRETSRRKPGKLAFVAPSDTPAVIREGEAFSIPVRRTAGADGVVTGVVSLAVGTKKLETRKLVWSHGETADKAFTWQMPATEGIQEDQKATLTLSAQGGATRVSPYSVSLILRDELMTDSFKDYNKSVLGSKGTVSGAFWFYGKESASDQLSVLRSSDIKPGRSSSLTVTFAGPGVLVLNVGLRGDAAATVSLDSRKLASVGASPLRIAVPSGNKKVKIAVSNPGGEGAFATARWDYVPLKGFRLMSRLPLDKSAVAVSEAFGLQAACAEDVVFPPQECPIRVEVLAGGSSAKLHTLPLVGRDGALTSAFFRYPESDGEREPLMQTIGQLIGKTFYWRMDVIYEDGYGNRALCKGGLASVKPREAAAPHADISPAALPAGWTCDEFGIVEVPPFTVGVAAEAVGLPVEGLEPDDVLQLSVKNGKLPSGLSLKAGEGAIRISGTPTKAADWQTADAFIVLKRRVGKSNVTVSGTSVRFRTSVMDLGDVAATYSGFRMSAPGSDLSERGMAELTVSSKGKISGKFAAGGSNFTFSASCFTARTGGAFFADGIVAKCGKGRLPVALRLELGLEDCDVLLSAGEGEYRLYRPDWKSPEGKARLAKIQGYYTAAFPVREAFPSAGAPCGIGYAKIAVKSSGTVSYSGIDSLGKSFSGTSPLLRVHDCCNDRGYVTVFRIDAKPTGYSQTGSGMDGIVEFVGDGDSGIVHLEAFDERGIELVNLNPDSVFGRCAWSNRLDVVGGSYDTSAGLDAGESWICRELEAFDDLAGRGVSGGWGLVSRPQDVTLVATSATKASFLPNDWFSKWTYTRSSGLATGTFALRYASDASPSVKKHTYTVKAILVRNSSEGGAFWAGHYIHTEKRGSKSYSTPLPFMMRAE